MTIKEYLRELKVLAKKYPDAEVVFACDGAGSMFERLKYFPGEGHYENEENNFVYHGEDAELEINAICVN